MYGVIQAVLSLLTSGCTRGIVMHFCEGVSHTVPFFSHAIHRLESVVKSE